MKTRIPLWVKYSPIKKLALIPFEKNPDRLYRGFELQYIESESMGNGYRIIAYRNDNYVDVYDDTTLKFQEDETFDIVENGLNQHIQTAIHNVSFEQTEAQQHLSFSFSDLDHRKIEFSIEEKTKRKSKPMNLLAPVGLGAQKPDCMPVFFMYNFDFIRKRKTKACCTIDGKKVVLDSFPIPMNWQFRYYTRYSNECELLEFANVHADSMEEVELSETLSYTEGNVTYFFEDRNRLKSIEVNMNQSKIEIRFEPSLDMNQSGTGTFSILPRIQMGLIRGRYEVKKNQDTIELCIVPGEGWKPVPNSFITTMIMSKKSVFCCWCKQYEYRKVIDLKNQTVTSGWVNHSVS